MGGGSTRKTRIRMRRVGLAVVWHHGTPNIGAPPQPQFAASERLGIHWVSYDRPGYGGSSPNPGRSVATAAFDVAAVADAVGIDRFSSAEAALEWLRTLPPR
jgi:pimeloyl-ACP methyl ester carboxylesterase